MNLDTNALLKAAVSGFGAGVIFTLGQIVPFVGLVCCCLMPLIWAGAGMLYGLWAANNGSEIDAGQFAIGGALAGAASGLGSVIVNGTLVAIAGLGIIVATYEDLGIDMTGATGDVAALAIGAIAGLCVVLFIAAGLGAAGGAIHAALTRDKGGMPAV